MRASIVIFAVFLAIAYAGNWAVLIAGSNTWGNYRHQADIMHAYQILSKNGYPDSNIITFGYGDLANNKENPTPGVIINKPDGPNVYTGYFNDYAGDNCTKANLFAVLLGEKSKLTGGSGKVLESTSEDNVFIYFADHGGTGLICMPVGPWIYSNELNPTLNSMHEKKLYKKLVFYMEACESGSMFDNILSSGINIFAETAANPDQSSYAIYFDSKRNTYLGDAYSVHWMEDSDLGKLSTETLTDQYNTVKTETTTSEVCKYGDVSFMSDTLDKYQAFGKAADEVMSSKKSNALGVDSRDVELHTLLQKHDLAETSEERKALRSLLRKEKMKRGHIDAFFRKLSVAIMGEEEGRAVFESKTPRPVDGACIGAVVEHFREKGQFDDYALKHARVIANLCNRGISPERIINSAKKLHKAFKH